MLNHQSVSNTKPVPSGTLRGHTRAVSALGYIYIPSNISYRKDTVHPLLLPTLLTADETGLVIWWDLNTKRPLGSWQAHDASIVTVRQLGVTWAGLVPELDFSVYGKVLTHGRDHSVKIWDLFEVLDKETMVYKFKVYRDTKPQFTEIPVNALNYCNVDLCVDRLVTTSTVNPNNFDIYVIPNGDTTLDRIFKDVNLYELINPLEESGRDFGILMKLSFIDHDTVCVGYESGDVIIISIANYEIEVLFHDSETHRPNPVLAMAYDSVAHIVFVTSANDKILMIHKLDSGYETTTHSIKHHGISSLSVRSEDSMLAMVTWDGFTRVYNYEQMKLIYKINKLSPLVKINDTNLDEKLNIKIKLVQLEFCPLQLRYQDLKMTKSLIYNNGTSKMIVRKREEMAFDKTWFVIGFNDGRVVMYCI